MQQPHCWPEQQLLLKWPTLTCWQPNSFAAVAVAVDSWRHSVAVVEQRQRPLAAIVDVVVAAADAVVAVEQLQRCH